MLNFIKTKVSLSSALLGYLTYKSFDFTIVSSFYQQYTQGDENEDQEVKKYLFLLDQTPNYFFTSSCNSRVHLPKAGQLYKYYCAEENKEKIGIIVAHGLQLVRFSKKFSNSIEKYSSIYQVPKNQLAVLPFHPKYLKKNTRNKSFTSNNFDLTDFEVVDLQKYFVNIHMIKTPVFTIVDVNNKEIIFEDEGFFDMDSLSLRITDFSSNKFDI